MELEDEFVQEINDYEERISKEIHLKEEAQRKQEEAQRKQKEAQRKQEEAILMLLASGVNPKKIASQLDLPIDYILSLKK